MRPAGVILVLGTAPLVVIVIALVAIGRVLHRPGYGLATAETALFLGPALLLTLATIAFVAIRWWKPEKPMLMIDNDTGHAILVEILGVSDDHEYARIEIPAHDVYRHELDVSSNLGLCVGTGVTALDASGDEIARLNQPLCATEKWTIGVDRGRYVSYLGQRS